MRLEVIMEDSITIKRLLGIIKKRWGIIALLIILFTALSWIVTNYVLTPTYQSSTQILVNGKNSFSQLDSTQMRSNIDLINTYSVIIKSPVILDKVKDELKLGQSVEDLQKNITVNSKSDSQVFSLTARDTDHARSVKMVNTISEIFEQEIKNIMNIDNVNILARAELKENPKPTSPNKAVNLVLGIVAGCMVGLGLVILMEFMDNSLNTSEDVERYLELPVLGTVQKLTKPKLSWGLKKKRKRRRVLEKQIEL